MNYHDNLLGFSNYCAMYLFHQGGTVQDFMDMKYRKVCFSSIFRMSIEDNVPILLKLKICKTNYLLKSGYNHKMLISVNDLKMWLDQINQIVSFEYDLIKQDDNFYELQIDNLIVSKFQLKWLLTALRCCYEDEKSITLYETFSLLKQGLIETTEILSVFLLLSRFYPTRECHSLLFTNKIPTVISNMELKDILANKTDIDYVNNILKYNFHLEYNKYIDPELKRKADKKSIIAKYETSYKPYFLFLQENNLLPEYIKFK